jgi:ArsR family transcriptional regulator
MNVDLQRDPTTLCCRPLAAPALSRADAEETARMFKALADPARVQIVNLLATEGCAVCVCELTPPLGLAQPTVSHHLKKLHDAGLVTREQRGTWAYYALDRDALARVRSLLDMEGVIT